MSTIIDDSDLMVVFQATDGTNQLLTSTYDNQTEQWSAANPLIKGLQACNPVLTTYEGIFYTAYQPWDGKVVGKLYIASSEDGVEWKPSASPIAPNIGGPHSCMTEFRGALYNIYQEINTARLCIIYSNDGAVWSAPAYISNYATKTNPSVTASEGLLYLVYQALDSLQLMITTTEDCLNWSAPVPLFNGMQACNPSITSFEGKLYVAYQPWNQKVIGELYVASYGNGSNWQHTSAPIVPNMGGCSPVISVFDGTLQIVYQEMNSARLCITSSDNGVTWTPYSYISNYTTLTPPAANSTLKNEVRRKLENDGIEIIANADLPDPSKINFICALDSIYNWENKPAIGDGWGFTGIVNWRECKTNDDTLEVGTVYIFPGNRLTRKQYVRKYTQANPGYTGKAQINGADAPALYFIDRSNAGCLHGQLCNMLKPADQDLDTFMSNFLGFAYDGQSRKKLFHSNSLNSPWFIRYDTNAGTPAQVPKTTHMSKDWETYLTDALNTFFK